MTRITRDWTVLGLSVVLCLATRAETRGPFPVQPFGGLTAASALQTPFADGDAHPPNARNCGEWLAVADSRSGADSGPMKITRARCLVVQAVAGAKASKSSTVSGLKWDAGVLAQLPPELGIHVSDEALAKAKRSSAKGESWTKTDPTIKAKVISPNEIEVTGTGFSERVILWAAGDFNGDHKQDILVQTLDTLPEGTYRNTRVFILTRKSAASRFKVVRQLL